MVSEFIWLALKLKNIVIKVIIPFFSISTFLLIAFVCFFAAIAGGCIFPPFEKVSRNYSGVLRYDIIRFDYGSPGGSWSNYKMQVGIIGTPFSYSIENYYGGRGIRDEINRIEWKKENKKIIAYLYIDDNLVGKIVN